MAAPAVPTLVREDSEEETILTVRNVVGSIVGSVVDEQGAIPVNMKTLQLLKGRTLLALSSVLQRISAVLQSSKLNGHPHPPVNRIPSTVQLGEAVSGYFADIYGKEPEKDAASEAPALQSVPVVDSPVPLSNNVLSLKDNGIHAPVPSAETAVGHFPSAGTSNEQNPNETLETASTILTLQNAALGLTALLHVLYKLLDGQGTPERLAMLLRAADDRCFILPPEFWDDSSVSDDEGRSLLASVRALFSDRRSWSESTAPNGSSKHSRSQTQLAVDDQHHDVVSPAEVASLGAPLSAVSQGPSTVVGSPQNGTLSEDESAGLLESVSNSAAPSSPAHPHSQQHAWTQESSASKAIPITTGGSSSSPTLPLKSQSPLTYAEELERLIMVVERLSRGRYNDQRSNTTLAMMGVRGGGSDSPNFAFSQSTSSIVSDGTSSSVAILDTASPDRVITGFDPRTRNEVLVTISESPNTVPAGVGSSSSLKRGASRSLPSLIASSIRRKSAAATPTESASSSVSALAPSTIRQHGRGQRTDSEASLTSLGRRHSDESQISRSLLDKNRKASGENTPLLTSKQRLVNMFHFQRNHHHSGERARIAGSAPLLHPSSASGGSSSNMYRGGPGSAYVVSSDAGATAAAASTEKPKKADLKALMPVIDRIMASPRLENQRVQLSESQERVLAGAALVSLVERISRGRMNDQRQECDKINLSFTAPIVPGASGSSSNAKPALFGLGKKKATNSSAGVLSTKSSQSSVSSSSSAGAGAGDSVSSRKRKSIEESLDMLIDVIGRVTKPDPALDAQRYEIGWEKRRETELRKVEGIMDRMARGRMENQVWLDESTRRLDDIENNIAPILERVATRTPANDQQRYIVSKDKERSMFVAGVVGTMNRARMDNQDAEHPKDRELSKLMAAMDRMVSNKEMDKQRYVPGKKTTKAVQQDSKAFTLIPQPS